MKKIIYIFCISILLSACSTGKKALEKGDYFSAVLKSVQRLKSNPENKKAIRVLNDAYNLAISWSQEEMDLIFSSNSRFKWSKAVGLMKRVNDLAYEIRLSPAARKIIPELKTYTSELEMASGKAAEEMYSAGIFELEENTKESARIAFDYFFQADEFIPGYKDVRIKLEESKNMATIKVILEAIPVYAQKYRLSSGFFYSKVFEFLNRNFPEESFVNFYSPSEAKNINLEYPDFIVRLEFYDFMIGNTKHFEKEEEVRREVEINKDDTTKIETINYIAKLKTITDEISSGGLLEMKIVDFSKNRVMKVDKISGSFTWINDYAIFAGDIEALNKKQKELVKRKAIQPPHNQELFVEFTKPIYGDLTIKINRFFQKYK